MDMLPNDKSQRDFNYFMNRSYESQFSDSEDLNNVTVSDMYHQTISKRNKLSTNSHFSQLLVAP